MAALKTLAQACTPRESVFNPAIRDTVYDIDQLQQIEPDRFFAENYITQGMRQLLAETFKRLEGKSDSTSGTFLLSQSMGGGKTHSLIALGLLARHPTLREKVMARFYAPGPLGAVRVVTFSGRKTNTPFGIWGDIAEQLNKKQALDPFYSPLTPPGTQDWIELLRGEPVLLLLDELPPYFQALQAKQIGATTLDVITTTAIANLLVAVSGGQLPQVCLVLTDLRASAYGAGSARMSEALRDLDHEANRSVTRIDPVRLNTDELYHILRTRLFDQAEPSPEPTDAITRVDPVRMSGNEPIDILRARLFETAVDYQTASDVAHAFGQAVDEARKMDMTTASAAELAKNVQASYPFHPGIRDLYARFKENPGFQQTRALIRIMRIIVADLWQSGAAREKFLIGAHDIDLHRADILSELRQINPTLEEAVAHDIAAEGGVSVAEHIDGDDSTETQDAAKLIFLSSLSQAVNPTLGLDRSDIVAYLAAPGRNPASLREALDQLQRRAWYLHATSAGALLVKNVENVVAKLESYVQGMLREQREIELRERLETLFRMETRACYQDLKVLPALDQVTLTQDAITLIVFRPAATAEDEIRTFYDHQQYKNRVLFLSGSPAAYERVLERAAYLRAVRLIIDELKRSGIRETDPQLIEAEQLRTREESQFYMACRETFQRLYYPSRAGLTPLDFDPKYVANKYLGEQQILEELKGVAKYQEDASAESPAFRSRVENQLWPAESKEALWSEIKRRAATDPAWIWHHRSALDDLRTTLVMRDIWRASDGYVIRGPFLQTTDVVIQELSRDDDTGEAQLRVKPLHGDTVHWSTDGTATPDSDTLPEWEFSTRELRLSFLATDSTGEHRTGEAQSWANRISLKHRFYQDSDRVLCELRGAPAGAIRYSTDGSNPETAGQPYTAPFPVPPGTRYVLAVASAAGITSNRLQAEPPAPDEVDTVTVDPVRPAVWKRRQAADSTGEVYQHLDLFGKHGAILGGVRLTAAKEGRYAELLTDAQTFQVPGAVRDLAATLSGIVAGASLALEVEGLRFERGQQLLDLVADLRATLQPNEVEQAS